MRRHAKASPTGSSLDRVCRRSSWHGTLLALVVLLILALAPGSASALNTRVPTSFSPIDGTGTGAAFSQTPTDIAIDQTTGNVFVLLGSEVRIFNGEGGVPVGIAPPYNITGIGFSRSIEIDNSSSSPSQGTVYVASQNTVRKFVRDGGSETYIAAGELIGAPALSEIQDIAVGPGGNVFVACSESATCTTTVACHNGVSLTCNRTLVEFAPTGTELRRFATYAVSDVTAGNYRPTDLAVSSEGDLFVTQLDSNGELNYIWKYPADEAGLIQPETYVAVAAPPLPPVAGTGSYYRPLAMDSIDNQLYVAERTLRIVKYDAATLAKDTATFGPEFLTQRGRFAVNPVSDQIFSADLNKVVVFGPEVPLATINANETSSTGTTALLNAAINPHGTTIEECTFEYGATAAYGSSLPCDGPLPADSNFHPVTAALSGLTPQGQTYHFRIEVKNSNGTAATEDQIFTTPDIYETDETTAITDSTATLNGTIKPNGAPLTECEFEYGLTSVSQFSKPCSPGAASIAGDFGEHAVAAELTGLQNGAVYTYRISAASSLGSFQGATRSFLTGGPVIAEQSAAPKQHSATITTYINPRGLNTNYHYEFGTDTSYGSRIPRETDAFAGSGTALVKGTAELADLTENTTYHYRVVASSEAGTTLGPDQEFTTTRSNASCPNASVRAGQTSPFYPEGTVDLPQCMALEMVSPPAKFNQYAKNPVLSASGERVKFESIAALADTPKLEFTTDDYVATRTPSGWVTSSTQFSPQLERARAPCTYSTDLSHWNGWGSTIGQAAGGSTTVFNAGIGVPFFPISSLLNSGSDAEVFVNAGNCEGGSADASHMFFAIGRATYIAGDPVPSANGSNVYEAYLDEETPSVELVQRDKDGVVYGGRCGAVLGGEGIRRGSVSADASRVYFTTRPGQPAGVACDPTTYKQRIMVRERTEEGPVIAELFSSECTRVSPPCSATNDDDRYLRASQEGSRVLFSTARQLADSDLDTTTDLYLYDETMPEGSRLTQVSAGDATDPTPGAGAQLEGLADFSGDGSHVYFVAKDTLTTAPNAQGRTAIAGERNLYLYQRDAEHPGGRTALIATLASGDSLPAVAVPAMGPDVEDLSVGGDGHVLFFSSKAALTPSDSDGGATDIYRYDAETGSLERISRAAPGGSDNGNFGAFGASGSLNSIFPGSSELAFNRGVSEDGRTVLFATNEALDPNDTDGSGTYIWHAGTVTAVPGPLPLGDTSFAWSLSLSGKEAILVSKSQLLTFDGDSVEDVYVLRANGGFPPPPPPNPCQGEACQEPFRAQPPGMSAASESFSGSGNEKSSVARKPKKHRKRKGQKAKHRKGKRVGHRQGGQK